MQGVDCALCGRSEQPQGALELLSKLQALALFDHQVGLNGLFVLQSEEIHTYKFVPSCTGCQERSLASVSRASLNYLQGPNATHGSNDRVLDVQRMYQDAQQQFEQLAELQTEAGILFEEMMYFDGTPSPCFCKAVWTENVHTAKGAGSGRCGSRGFQSVPFSPVTQPKMDKSLQHARLHPRLFLAAMPMKD